MPAFFAFLNHIYVTLSPTLHTPVMLIAQPAWTAKNHEDITAFIFEKFKTPALCIMDSALATSYAYGIANATIIDVGFEKVDVTAITDYQITGRGVVPNSGGEAMTQRLITLLKSKNFTRDMAEQLKKNFICEILPPGTPLPGTESAEVEISNPAAAATTGATSSGPDVRITTAPRDVEVVDDDQNGEETLVDDDGVLDIAAIITSGKEKEIIAKMDKEKKSLQKKAEKDARNAAEAAAAKPSKLPNSKKPRAIFKYQETIQDGPDAKRQKTPDPVPAPPAEEPASVSDDAKHAEDGVPNGSDAPAPAAVDEDAARRERLKAARNEQKRKAREEEHPDQIQRDIEIGTERFQAADADYLDAIADTVYRTVLSVDEISKRQDAWDSLVICGCGSKVRGFKDALISTLNSHYLVSPSSATMFMSELPSNLATPSGTGSMTPIGSFSSTPHQPPTASAVNPLLLAATTASNPALNPSTSITSYNASHQTHSSHSQSPTSIKVASPPTYFPEWLKAGYDEAVFLGSQVAAKVIFVTDQGISKGFLSRVEFNEDGPSAIHQV
jgi:actin-related protein 9